MDTKAQVQFSNFLKIDLRVGTIIRAEINEHSHKPSYIVHVDFGEKLGTLKSSAQITDCYELTELHGKQIIAVVNFPPKQVAKTISEFLVLGVVRDDDSVVLLQPERPVLNGLSVS